MLVGVGSSGLHLVSRSVARLPVSVRVSLQVGVSMVLSFMVVWDLPAISKGISSLQTSRLSAIYNEVAPSLAVFGMLFGKALQAQVEPASNHAACQSSYKDCLAVRLLSQIAVCLSLQAQKARWWLRHSLLLGIAGALPSQVSEMWRTGGCMRMQARIAVVNTALTAAGMWALAIPGVGLLSLFVFICSFIPIAGCFISTVPVAFVALTEYGFLKVSSRPSLHSIHADSRLSHAPDKQAPHFRCLQAVHRTASVQRPQVPIPDIY